MSNLLICRLTGQPCQTTSMCSPFGGCAAPEPATTRAQEMNAMAGAVIRVVHALQRIRPDFVELDARQISEWSRDVLEPAIEAATRIPSSLDCAASPRELVPVYAVPHGEVGGVPVFSHHDAPPAGAVGCTLYFIEPHPAPEASRPERSSGLAATPADPATYGSIASSYVSDAPSQSPAGALDNLDPAEDATADVEDVSSQPQTWEQIRPRIQRLVAQEAERRAGRAPADTEHPVATEVPDSRIVGLRVPSFEPIREVQPGQIATRALVTCARCAAVIRTSGGPIRDALCLKCWAQGAEDPIAG